MSFFLLPGLVCYLEERRKRRCSLEEILFQAQKHRRVCLTTLVGENAISPWRKPKGEQKEMAFGDNANIVLTPWDCAGTSKELSHDPKKLQHSQNAAFPSNVLKFHCYSEKILVRSICSMWWRREAVDWDDDDLVRGGAGGAQTNSAVLVLFPLSVYDPSKSLTLTNTDVECTVQ